MCDSLSEQFRLEIGSPNFAEILKIMSCIVFIYSSYLLQYRIKTKYWVIHFPLCVYSESLTGADRIEAHSSRRFLNGLTHSTHTPFFNDDGVNAW